MSWARSKSNKSHRHSTVEGELFLLFALVPHFLYELHAELLCVAPRAKSPAPLPPLVPTATTSVDFLSDEALDAIEREMDTIDAETKNIKVRGLLQCCSSCIWPQSSSCYFVVCAPWSAVKGGWVCSVQLIIHCLCFPCFLFVFSSCLCTEPITTTACTHSVCLRFSSCQSSFCRKRLWAPQTGCLSLHSHSSRKQQRIKHGAHTSCSVTAMGRCNKPDQKAHRRKLQDRSHDDRETGLGGIREESDTARLYFFLYFSYWCTVKCRHFVHLLPTLWEWSLHQINL